jgi:hypothetical protein
MIVACILSKGDHLSKILFARGYLAEAFCVGPVVMVVGPYSPICPCGSCQMIWCLVDKEIDIL